MSDTNEPEKETALVEAVLLLESNPLGEDVIGKICGFTKETVEIVLSKLQERYKAPDCALEISRINDTASIFVKKELLEFDNIKERYGKRNEAKISRAAMETLAVVAYSQPVTRTEIERIRGVSADNMIRLLLDKNLVRVMGKKDIPGKPAQYGTTKNFLEVFGLDSIAQLPKLNESDIEKFELEGEKY